MQKRLPATGVLSALLHARTSARLVLALLLVAIPALAVQLETGPRDGGETPAVFRQFAGQVVKVQVVEQRSGAKAVTGTGFYVSRAGHVMTNYHVVSNLVRHPERYRAELIDSTAATRVVTIVAVDVVHDLAVLATGQPVPRWFTLEPARIPHGLRLYSLGHPGDMGIAIVEGTYNGRLPHTLYPRIHFTGSINSGMSGGPTITLQGRVVGVNVATSGNGRGFLVPADDASALLTRALAEPARPTDSLLADVGRQLLAYQLEYIPRLFADSVPTVDLGGLRVPTQPAAFFNCWGDADQSEDQPFESVHHYCTTNDDVFLTGDESTGLIEFEHSLITSEHLNRFRFTALYTHEFLALGRDWELGKTGNDDLTGYRCRADNVREGNVTAKAVFCARRYKKLPGLYDAVLRVAVLGRPTTGVISTLTMSGVSFANAQAMVRRFTGAIRWSE